MTVSLPWHDRRGRFSTMRATTFAILALPALWYLVAFATQSLGARPLLAVQHATGEWTVWFLLASLAISPARAAFALPQLPPLRRMVGLGALFYVLVHLVLYAATQSWRILHVASEIALRFYLTVGFVALLILAALGITSTDNQVKRLGRHWKRLHRIVYLAAALGAWHFMLQSKADISLALLAGGIVVWMLLWRLLPAGPDRQLLPLLGLAVAAAVVTLGLEWAWFRFGTHIDPARVVAGEFRVAFGLQPADQVLALGVLVALAVELRRLALAGYGARLWFTPLAYAAGGVAANLAYVAVNLEDYPPDWGRIAVWAALFALMGAARTRLPQPGQRQLLDWFYVALLLSPLSAAVTDSMSVPVVVNAAVALAALLLVAKLWTASPPAALLIIPIAAWGAYASATLL
ncbi:MAG: ferric reductase-like transmembrane domain-containing protein [Pseudomonadota bacterium]|nr:ferric reductase-like transmembrane domain-containing protein [Pseudomonadota bacterium]